LKSVCMNKAISVVNPTLFVPIGILLTSIHSRSELTKQLGSLTQTKQPKNSHSFERQFKDFQKC
jgi:hypothetical protein